MTQVMTYLSSVSVLLIGLLSVPVVNAAPLITPRQSITVLTQAQISPYKTYTYFASAGYCKPATTSTWSCGANCQANPGFVPIATGGDGSSVQYWFVGYNPSSQEVIVSHQGTDPSQLAADYTDVDFFLENLDPTLFPGISSSVEVHNGFADEHAKTATGVLAGVQSAMSRYAANKVTMVGHSLGAALALLDSVYLPLYLPSTTAFKTVTYGMPRVGNPAFANYVDAHAHVTHINNKEDPIPTVPGRFLDFAHPSGEIHIQDSGSWDACPGQDNPSTLCTVGDVPYVWDGDASDHDGPYDGVTMGC